MRLQRGTPVAGMEPEVARKVARLCRRLGGTESWIASRMGWCLSEAKEALGALEDEGFIHLQTVPYATEPHWVTTVRGNALAMASFLKPITRSKADSLLAGVIERAVLYNADPDKLITVLELRVFGSYLDVNANDIGDVDIAMTWRWKNSPPPLFEYASRSRRNFSSISARLNWAETELHLLLRNRSPFINITDEDITELTQTWRTVYSIESQSV